MGVSQEMLVEEAGSGLLASVSICPSMQMPNANEFIQHTTSKVINTPSADFMQR